MVRTEALLVAIERIHAAPLVAGGWTQALPALADAFGSQQVNFHVQDAQGQAIEFVTAYGFDPGHEARFRAAASARALPPRWQAIPTGEPSRVSEIWADGTFQCSAFYNEVVRHTGSFHALQTLLLKTPEQHVHLILPRAVGLDDYENEDIAAMRRLVPHLVTALRVGQRLAAADLRASGACAALDHVGTGVMLVDAEARVLFANRLMRAVLARNEGFSTDGTVVSARDPRAARALRAAIAGCAKTALGAPCPAGAIEVPRGDGRPALHATVALFRPDAVELDVPPLGGGRPVAMLMVTDPERERSARGERSCRRFGLTPAEANVAMAILGGDGREAAARQLGITVATVKTHLLHIFEKTGVRRQKDLVRILLEGDSSPAGD